jgi:NAD(P)-dependent dehydrogenase (short-subunit alcohol dehydrogenase family)
VARGTYVTTDIFSLRNRVAVVTGGSRGLGRAIAEGLAAHGASVLVASRKLDACERAAREIRAATGADARAARCHVGDWADCGELISFAVDQFGRMDILVNNAGMSPLYESLASVSEDLFDKVIAVNLKGPFRLCALAAELMNAGDGGTIINVGSIASSQPTASEVPYAAAKAGLNTLTVAFAHAFGPKVRVNGIMPGPFLTDISKAWDLESFDRRAREHIPAGRGGQAAEIVGAAIYLASPAASYTTGAIIKIDGGASWAPA